MGVIGPGSLNQNPTLSGTIALERTFSTLEPLLCKRDLYETLLTGGLTVYNCLGLFIVLQQFKVVLTRLTFVRLGPCLAPKTI